jgi:hypothetical protein
VSVHAQPEKLLLRIRTSRHVPVRSTSTVSFLWCGVVSTSPRYSVHNGEGQVPRVESCLHDSAVCIYSVPVFKFSNTETTVKLKHSGVVKQVSLLAEAFYSRVLDLVSLETEGVTSLPPYSVPTTDDRGSRPPIRMLLMNHGIKNRERSGIIVGDYLQFYVYRKSSPKLKRKVLGTSTRTGTGRGENGT